MSNNEVKLIITGDSSSATTIECCELAYDLERNNYKRKWFNIYAYDAYYLQGCIENKSSFISLDDRMCTIAGNLGIKVVE